MGGSGSYYIAGHSGTQFKHRRAFGKVTELNNKKVRISNKFNSKNIDFTHMESNNAKDLILEVRLKMIAFGIIAICLLLAMIVAIRFYSF